MKDDALTIAALAVLAASIAAVAHEGAHAVQCLALGGQVELLTSVYFQCTIENAWIPAAGPLGNLAAATLSWLALRASLGGRLRFLALMIMALSAFWFAGYLVYAGVRNDGDPYYVARRVIGEPGPIVRIVAIAAGIVAYGIAIRLLRLSAPARRALVVGWLAASLSACLAALAATTHRFAATGQAALEIGASGLPLLIVARSDEAMGVTRSWPWIGAALVGFALFIFTFGRGLP